MKKILLPILLFVMFIPFEVGAKEYCKVVDGDGKSIGSEISCGSEHFYIIDSNEDEIKMLAKYNLYTGVTIYKEKLEEGQTCAELASSNGGVVKHDDFYNAPGYCFYSVRIEEEKILQKEEAKSAHWDEDLNYLYPQIGDVYISYSARDADLFFRAKDTPVQENTKFYDFEINMENEDNDGLIKSLRRYKEGLEEENYTINKIELLSLSELENIINKISNQSLPLQEWSQNVEVVTPGTFIETEVHFGDLKPYISPQYSWLYSTTYWNSTLYEVSRHPTYGPVNYYVFVAEQGKLCGAGFHYCAPETVLGCGLRPVITIPNELQYIIKTETDGNGTIDVIDNSLGGETIQFKVSAKNGYKLGSIVIKTDSGEKVEFSEGEITKNDDGTFSIDKNKFTMPFENITIQAKFELESILKNPKTGDKILFIIFTLVASIGIGIFIYKKKESRYNV